MNRGRRPGTPKTGGRRRGSLNKSTLARLNAEGDLRTTLEGHGCSLPERIALFLHNDEISPLTRMEWILKLIPYLYPMLKSVDPDTYMSVNEASDMLGKQFDAFKEAISIHLDDASVMNVIAALRSEE